MLFPVKFGIKLKNHFHGKSNIVHKMLLMVVDGLRRIYEDINLDCIMFGMEYSA